MATHHRNARKYKATSWFRLLYCALCRASVALLVLLVCSASQPASAQNIQVTQGSVGSGLDNTIQIPIVAYPGRGAASLPVTLYYSSKVWRVGHYYTFANNALSKYQSVAEAIFSEHSTAGWKTSLDLPEIEWPKPEDQWSYQGATGCGTCPGGGGWRINRLYVHMPDGSTHELRKDDNAHLANSVGQSGIFYAVDGSRMRYNSAGPTTGKLYLPDGSRYELNGSSGQFLLDPCVGSSSPPNRVRDFTSVPAQNSTFGTLDFRYTFTNMSGAAVTRLRFRIIDLTTFPVPSGYADLRPRSSADVVVTVDRAPCGSGTSNVTVHGTTLEQPSSQPKVAALTPTFQPAPSRSPRRSPTARASTCASCSASSRPAATSSTSTSRRHLDVLSAAVRRSTAERRGKHYERER